MRQALLYGPRDLRVVETPVPDPGPGEVRVRITLSSIYGTDVKYYTGYHVVPSYPIGVGAEFVGVVESQGPGATLAIGQRVIPDIPHCGECRFCQSGRTNLCVTFANPVTARKNQTFQDYAIWNERSLIPIPDSISDDDAATISALSLTSNMFELANQPKGARIAIIGIGAMGIGAVQNGARLGHEIAAIDTRAHRLPLAREMGATHGFTWDELPDAIRTLWDHGADCVLDLAGSEATANLAFDLVIPGGAVVFGVSGGWTYPSRIIGHKELKVFGIRGSHHRHQVIPEMAAGRLGLGRTITHRFPLDRIADAFEAALDPASGRIAVDHR